jgi:hypothetical protein
MPEPQALTYTDNYANLAIKNKPQIVAVNLVSLIKSGESRLRSIDGQ